MTKPNKKDQITDKDIGQEKETHEKQALEYKDKWLRALADYDNLKKRAQKEKQDFLKFSNQFLIAELFPIMDSFDSAIVSIEKSNDKESFLKGIKMLQKEFHRVLEVNGLKKIKSLGEKFDPNMHQAEEEIVTDKYPEGTVAEEILSGYTLSDRLLRPAVVKVAKGRAQKTEDRGQKTEDRGQKTEDRGQKAEDRGQRTEDREQRTEDRGQKTEGEKSDF